MTTKAHLTESMAVDVVNEVLGSKRERWQSVSASTPLAELDLDSLEVAELFAMLEDRSGVDLDPDSATSLKTVGDLAGLEVI
jgi:acyl carrier protein